MSYLCLAFYTVKKDKDAGELPEPENPAQFKAALIFGLLYGVILLLVAFAKEQFGNEGLYIVAIISGLTDVDAITLSMSNMIKGGGVSTSLGWKLILLASLANLLFKGIMAMVIGTGKIVKWLALTFGLSIAIGMITIFLWPENWHF
ncbi:DUF4010 domain-containing protein [Zunongwangia sp. H14]|uniref:DUF4010 domain-containing protein n=1 Tax=Zunongwangia sp. H14 TaxID=3240792 RepID=UPI0035631779